MDATDQPTTTTASQSSPESAIGQAEATVDKQAATALSVLEQDAIEFIQSAARHAGEALPLLTGELGNGLAELLGKARELAAKHGFTL